MKPGFLRKIDLEKEKHVRIIAAIMLAFFVLTAATSVAVKSLTVDESVYIVAGYSYLKTGDYRMNPEHPVFGKMVLALPLLLMDPVLPLEKPAWADSAVMGNNLPNYSFAADFYAANLDNFFPIIFSARLMQIALGVFLGMLVFLWSKKLFGAKAALLALFFYVLSPNIMAHARIAALDFTLTVFVFAAFFFAFHFTRSGGFPHLFLSALFISFASLTKFSGIVFVPLLFLFIAMQHRELKKSRTEFFKKKNVLLYCAFVFLFVCLFILVFANALYSFDSYGDPASAGIIPARLLDGYDFISGWVQGGREGYLLGEFGTYIPHYFLAAFIFKTPLAFIILLAFSFYVFAKKRRLDSFSVLFPALLFFALVSLFTGFYLGLRYVLPVYPFLFVFASQTAGFLALKKDKKAKAVFALLLAWLFFSSVSIYPNYLAYFSELCGGPGNGQLYLSDSNIDWGQDLFQLMAYVKENNVENLNLIYFGWPYHALFFPEARYEPDCSKLHGSVAVSVTKIVGIFEGDSCLSFLLEKEPKAKIGWSIYYYELG